MALSVSMALSDLERNDFPQHKRLYNIGEEIVNQQLVAPPPPPPVAPRSRSSTLSSSNNSSRTSSPGPTGSRVGTPSPDITQEYPQWYPSQLSLRDFCMFKIDMAETSTQEKVKMLQLYDDAVKNAKPKEKKDDKKEDNKKEEKRKETKEDKQEPPFNGVMRIRWGDRNLLDLGGNIKSGWNMIQPAELQPGASDHLDNRSQFTRLDGEYCPRYCINRCNCDFEEPIYY